MECNVLKLPITFPLGKRNENHRLYNIVFVRIFDRAYLALRRTRWMDEWMDELIDYSSAINI